MRAAFALLAIWGAVHPMVWFARYLGDGHSFAEMIGAWYANAATTGLAWDMTIAATTLTVWAVTESVTRRTWWGLLAVPATFGIGLSCGLPLYLLLRTRGGPDRVRPA